MRVSLAPPRRPAPSPTRPLLERRGARVVLGAPAAAPVAPLAPSAAALFAPRGACLVSEAGPLVVCDTGHHRLLLWRKTPEVDGAAADLVVGQPDFSCEGRNAGGEPGAATLNVPTGVAAGEGVLAVADAWNHRVLLWRPLPEAANRPADVVLGQRDFVSGLANRGRGNPAADTLHWPYGVAIHEGRLYVADTGNRRVLVWHALPEDNGAPADLVLEAQLRWPHGIAASGPWLFVADAGRGRVIVWRALALQGTRAEECGMPYGVAVQDERLVVADTAASRLLGFELGRGPARWLAAQPTLNDSGENRWSFPARDSVSWPYGLAACGATLVVADSGNNRVLLWDRA